MGRARGRWGRLLLSEAQLEEVLGAQDQGEQEVRGCLEAQGCQEVPECQEEDTATQDVSASICPATWEVLECPQCHQPGLGLELDLVDLVPHLFLPRVETEQAPPEGATLGPRATPKPGSEVLVTMLPMPTRVSSSPMLLDLSPLARPRMRTTMVRSWSPGLTLRATRFGARLLGPS